MVDRFRAGIIGAGFIGGVHAHAVRAAGGLVAAVADHTPESTERAVGVLGAERAAVSVEELVHADDVDGVHICTPNHTHAALAEVVIAAGKPVICEKPLATTVQDARRLTELAQDADVVACVPFVYRFYPAVREARARIAAGEAGPLWLLHGSYLQDWLASAGATNWRVDPALGGASRAFGDIGVHWCDLMEFVTGHRITRLAARMGLAFANRAGTEDGAAVVFDTDQGATGSVVVSQVSPGRKNRLWFSFDGPAASYSFDQELPDSLWVGGTAHNQVVMRGPDTFGEAAAGYARLPAGHPQGYQDSFTAFVSDVYAKVAGRKPDGLPTFADGLRAAVLTQAVVEAATEQTWVEVPA
ncbi:Gfo/Idh/MocA family oxidoreductase [Pseudonocardia aurantiaca]|uniref:Gfo/Idh/MocA family protein n=1 Tax=Pseudonocardia aurantiaca TaxID=75290 RepID=A0ABW4G0B4_9PSEU